MAGCGDYDRFDWVHRSRGPIRINNSICLHNTFRNTVQVMSLYKLSRAEALP